MTTYNVDVYPSPSDTGDYLALFTAVRGGAASGGDKGKQQLPLQTYTSPDNRTIFSGLQHLLPDTECIPGDMDRVIIILDRSGSMGQHCRRILTESLPAMFNILKYGQDHVIDLVLFDCNTEHIPTKVKNFPTLPYNARGSTAMHKAFATVEKILCSYPQDSHVKIFTISDGAVDNIASTVENAGNLYKKIQTDLLSRLTIVSHALRLFTSSYASPDTTAVSSVLQLHTLPTETPTLVDLNVLTAEDNTAIQAVKANTHTPEQAKLAEQATLERSPVGHGQQMARLSKSPSQFATLSAALDVYNHTTYLLQKPHFTPTDAAQIALVDKINKKDFAMFKTDPWSRPTNYLSIPVNQKQMLFWLDRTKFDALRAEQQTPLTFVLSDAVQVQITQHDKLTEAVYEELMISRIDYYMMMCKLLRVVGDTNSLAKLDEMAAYFKNLEGELHRDIASTEVTTTDGMGNGGLADDYEAKLKKFGLKQRLLQVKQRVCKANRQLAQRIGEIAAMDRTTKFNSAQGAAFLRSVGTGKAARGLVDRNGQALDFDNIVRTEMKAVVQHLPELEDKFTFDDEAKFKESFVSKCTTLDSLRAMTSLCLTDTLGVEYTTVEELEAAGHEALIDTLPALEILSFLGIVGVPVVSTTPNGDFPDPYRYSLKAIFPGQYVSLGDMITHHMAAETAMGDQIAQDNGFDDDDDFFLYGIKKHLEVPGFQHDGKIHNVLPIFDNPAIFQFLYQHAPSSLSLYASVGMRRVLADIPGTLPATLSAGLLKMVKTCSVEPTAVNFETLYNIWSSLQHCSTLKYNAPVYTELLQVLHSFVNQLAEGKSEEEFLLPHLTTSLPQLFLPLLKLSGMLQHGAFGEHFVNAIADDELRLALTPEFIAVVNANNLFSALLRAIYTNEAWATLRNEYKGKQDGPEIIRNGLSALCGFDREFTPAVTKSEVQFNAETNVADYPTFAQRLAAPEGEENGTAVRPYTQRAAGSYLCSEKFNALQHKLAHLNVLLLIPALTALFNVRYALDKALTADPVDADVVKSCEEVLRAKEQALPILFNTQESIFQQIKSSQLSAEAQKEMMSAHSAVVRKNTTQNFAKVFANVDTTTSTNVKLVKLYNIYLNYLYPTQDERTPPTLPDWLNLLTTPVEGGDSAITPKTIVGYHTMFKQQEDNFLTDSEAKYDSTMAAFVLGLEQEIADEYIELLLNATTMTEFKALLKNGITRNNKTMKFQSYQHNHFVQFFNLLIQKKNKTTSDGAVNNIPLQCDKIITTILARDEVTDEALWNNGELLFLTTTLHAISKLFYTEGTDRTKWIEFSAMYLKKKREDKWKYRSTDLPNRHSHHLSKPSYFGLGYASLKEYQENVTPEEFGVYADLHRTCCGLKSAFDKRERVEHWVGKDYHQYDFTTHKVVKK